MKLLSHISSDGHGLPEPADARRLALGFETWREALALSGGDPALDLARSWSAADPGKRLLASIFGNSPFLSGVVVKEWAFLPRLIEEGADPLFSETAAGIEKPEDLVEDTAALMRRLRIAKRRVALVAAVAELVGAWSLEQQTAALSRFAEAALGAALRHLLREAARKGLVTLPDPDAPERNSGLIVLGVGKF
jgi:glutamate-ammonia-ligase adenylyltransferase